MWQQIVQHQFSSTERAMHADNKVTSPQIALGKAKEEDTKVVSISKTGPAQQCKKGKENPQANHHNSKDAATIAGSTATSVRTADNLHGSKIFNNSSDPKVRMIRT